MIITDEMIEAAGKAIYESDPRTHCPPVSGYPWTSQNETTRSVYRDMARAALTAVLPMMDGWQPIETAPKDEIILLTDGNNTYAGNYFKYDGCEWHFFDTPFNFDEDSTHRTYVKTEANGWITEHGAGPTHWRPLPPPPKGDGT